MLFVLMFTTFQLQATSTNKSLALSTCLTDSLNGKERKELAKWIYFGMSQHSTIKPYSNISNDDQIQMDQYLGKLMTRLLTVDCKSIVKSALEADSNSLEAAFGVVGRVAMEELMREKSVSRTLEQFSEYVDIDEF